MVVRRVSKHVRLPGLAALLAVLTAVTASPAVLDIIPQPWASIIIAAASITQAFTKPVKRERGE
jgi:hypothetical protein